MTGTKQIASFGSQPDGTALFTNIPDAFGVIGNSMVFAADAGSSDTELWKTDGTAAGTSMIKVIAPSQLGYTPSDFTTVGGKVFFVGNALVDLFLQSRNWPFGAACAVALVAIMLVTVTLYMRVTLKSGTMRDQSLI